MSDDAIVRPTADEWAVQATNAEWWHAAIGRVVTTAAGLEAAVGTLLHAMEVGDKDHLYALVIGRLIKRGRDQLPSLAQRDPQLAREIGELIDRIDVLLERRNDVYTAGGNSASTASQPSAAVPTAKRLTWMSIS